MATVATSCNRSGPSRGNHLAAPPPLGVALALELAFLNQSFDACGDILVLCDLQRLPNTVVPMPLRLPSQPFASAWRRQTGSLHRFRPATADYPCFITSSRFSGWWTAQVCLLEREHQAHASGPARSQRFQRRADAVRDCARHRGVPTFVAGAAPETPRFPEEQTKNPPRRAAGRAQIQFCDDELIALICRTSKALFR